MTSRSGPTDLFMRRHNYDGPRMSPEDGETPAEAFGRKRAPRVEKGYR